MEEPSPSSQSSGRISRYRDEDWHKQTTAKVSKYYHGLQRNDGESPSIYLQRLGTSHRLRDGDATRYDLFKEKTLVPLAQLALKCETAFMQQLAKTLTHGYCHCTDVVALSNGTFTQRLALLDFQTTGNAQCARCWFIAECIGKFADRWPGLGPADVKVWMGPLHIMHMKDILWGRGSARVFRVQWLDGTGNRGEGVYNLPRKIVLEIYYDPGGFPLYPNMTYRQTRPNEPSTQSCAVTIKAWIDQCEASHAFCNETQDSHFLPTRLVDVGSSENHEDIRLVQAIDIADESVKYTALSYCWGKKEERQKAIPKTKQATIQDHLTNIPWNELTQVFQDAIKVTRELNLRYVWVDALCIIQDDKQDFANEVSQMASIYGEAYIVLAATYAHTGDTGLFHRRTESHCVSRTDAHGYVTSVRVKEETAHADFTTDEPQNFTSTPLFARAWCFQERLLARRVVHFAEDELVFECKEKLWCECDLVEPEHPLYVNFKVRFAYSLCKDAVKARIRTWYSVLRPYTARSLSFESDRLPALSGIARLISTPDMGSYCAGLWSCALPSALLWRVLRALPENNGVVTRPAQYRAPTWSWASVQAVIEGHVAIHETIRQVARIIEVECSSSSSDGFGEVASGHIVLEAPVVDTHLQRSAGGASSNNRELHVCKVDNENEQLVCHADVYLADMTLPFIAVAIEQCTNGTDNDGMSCLLLQRERVSNVFCRVGIFNCPGRWFQESSSRTIKIV